MSHRCHGRHSSGSSSARDWVAAPIASGRPGTTLAAEMHVEMRPAADSRTATSVCRRTHPSRWPARVIARRSTPACTGIPIPRGTDRRRPTPPRPRPGRRSSNETRLVPENGAGVMTSFPRTVRPARRSALPGAGRRRCTATKGVQRGDRRVGAQHGGAAQVRGAHMDGARRRPPHGGSGRAMAGGAPAFMVTEHRPQLCHRAGPVVDIPRTARSDRPMVRGRRPGGHGVSVMAA